MKTDARIEKQVVKQDALEHSRLLELLAYDAETGLFRWAVSRGRLAKAGSVAGGPRVDGYWGIKLSGFTYLAHRLAWFYVYGVWPEEELDHIDRNRANNRIENLRHATRADNCRNKPVSRSSKTGVKGVWPHKNRFRAEIHFDGKQRDLGVYDTVDEARAVYEAAARKIHGDFAVVCQ